MRGLKGLLKRKIAITAIFWCIPLLLFPGSWFVALGVPSPEPIAIARLLGAAYLALLVGYYGGLRSIESGQIPFDTMHMGIASNGLAAILIAYFGATGAWKDWGLGATVFIWVSAAGAFSIALSLIRYRLRYAPAKAGEPGRQA
ncbi:hypothetical protein GCM10025771_22120 [Niveibacterium umoris]|uniref:Uncharacterized protein n=1 Tax=Niveibacterium umoris TaxID=1193620 RepID=A0A840BM41_9RHOO|nr:hypothetical protein [Niveibacterium umoris]MBB4012599.1 hypothetical protein [Niveibacterium umoris]